VKLLLSGEGYDDIGDWAKEPMYRASPPETGVIEALLRKIEAGELTVREAIPWKKIPKFRAALSQAARAFRTRQTHSALVSRPLGAKHARSLKISKKPRRAKQELA